MIRPGAILLLFLSMLTMSARAGSGGDSTRIIVLHEIVGGSIDSTEKAKFHLFTFWSAKQFDHAEFLQDTDSSLSIRGTMKDGSVYSIPCTKKEFDQYNYQVRYYSGLVSEKSSSSSNGQIFGGVCSAVVSGVITFIQVRSKR